MALIKCIDCNKEFSDRANECPNCGCPIEAIKAFPFNTIEEKDGYEHYLTLLQSNEEEVYTWTICKTCGETAQVDAFDEPVTQQLIKIIKEHNTISCCEKCGSTDLFITHNMPFPMVKTNIFNTYDHICQTYNQQVLPMGELYLSTESMESPEVLKLDPPHPSILVQRWEESFPDCIKQLSEERAEEAKAKFEAYKREQAKAQQSTPKPTPKKNEVHCPKCGSTQIQMVQRKWSLLTGFMTNKVDRVCVNCKHKF